MSLNDKMTDLGNAVRNISGISNKLNVSEMATTLNQFSAFKDYGIQKNGDFNKLIAPGTYNIQGGFDNRPIDNWGSLIVFSADTRTVQFFVNDHGFTFVRTCNHAIFDSPWVKLGGVTNLILAAVPLHEEVAA